MDLLATSAKPDRSSSFRVEAFDSYVGISPRGQLLAVESRGEGGKRGKLQRGEAINRVLTLRPSVGNPLEVSSVVSSSTVSASASAFVDTILKIGRLGGKEESGRGGRGKQGREV